MNNPNVKQKGQVSIDSGRQVIVPNARFNCNGRITSISVSMIERHGTDYPLFQVWHPTLLNSSTYSKIGEVQLPSGNFVSVSRNKNYHSATVRLNNSSQIEFQSGDVIGYYQPSNPQVSIWSNRIRGYTSYSNNAATPLMSIDINNVDYNETDRQPLIKVIFGEIKQICLCMAYYKFWMLSLLNYL